MEPEHVKGNNENVKRNSGGTPILEAKDQNLPSPYGSGIEFDISENGSIRRSSVQPQLDGNLSSYPQSGPSLGMSPNTICTPPGAIGHRNSSPESPIVSPDSSPMKSPPIQTMGHPPGYDPNRIPSSIFSSKPASGSEWSTTSNESLFSIQMGNNSFSRDYTFLFGKSDDLSRLEDWNTSQSNQLGMPGDFPRLEEWNNAQVNSQAASEAKSNTPTCLHASSPSATDLQSQDLLSAEPPGAKMKQDNTSSPVGPEAHEEKNHIKEKPIPPLVVDPPPASPKSRDMKVTSPVEALSPTPTTPTTFPSPPRFSYESGNSSSSFAFPLLLNNGGSKSVNSSIKGVSEKPEETKTQPPPLQPQPQSPLKPEPQPQSQPQPQQQSHPPQDPKDALNAVAGTRWCFCFPCLPRCC